MGLDPGRSNPFYCSSQMGGLNVTMKTHIRIFPYSTDPSAAVLRCIFAKMIRGLFYSEFDNVAGPVIVFQAPHECVHPRLYWHRHCGRLTRSVFLSLF
jgi:hypothetical protein